MLLLMSVNEFVCEIFCVIAVNACHSRILGAANNLRSSNNFDEWKSDSDFHCFGALGAGPGARTLLHVLAWHMGVIIAIVEPRS